MSAVSKVLAYSAFGLALIAMLGVGLMVTTAQTVKETQMNDDISPEPGPSGPSASRPPPPHVDPITIDGITYVQWYGSDQDSGVLEARKPDGTVLWNIVVYPVDYNPEVEKDGQEIFFRSMDVVEGKIQITNEMLRTYLVDPKSGAVTEIETPEN